MRDSVDEDFVVLQLASDGEVSEAEERDVGVFGGVALGGGVRSCELFFFFFFFLMECERGSAHLGFGF